MHPHSAIGPRRKSLRGVGERMGWAVALGMCRAGCKAESRHIRWEVTFPLHGWLWKVVQGQGQGAAWGREEKGVMDTQCSIPQESKAAQRMRSNGVLRGQPMERRGWGSCPALWSSRLHQLDLPLEASFSHLRAICPSLPAGGQQPSSHEQPCQVCSRRPAQPRLGKLGPKYRAKSRCSPWVTAHPECRRPGSISTDPCTAY